MNQRWSLEEHRRAGLVCRQPACQPVATDVAHGVRGSPSQPASAAEGRGAEVELRMQAYTVEQVAKMLHIGRDKVYYLIRTGQLRSIKIGKLRRITDKHLAEFVASREDAA